MSCRSITSASIWSSALSGGGSTLFPYSEMMGSPVLLSTPPATFVWSSVPRMPCSGEKSIRSFIPGALPFLLASTSRSASLTPFSSIPVWFVSRPTRLFSRSSRLSRSSTVMPGSVFIACLRCDIVICSPCCVSGSGSSLGVLAQARAMTPAIPATAAKTVRFCERVIEGGWGVKG